jgi:protein-S-isoprenylcysteine O-methyltransferase Ste14
MTPDIESTLILHVGKNHAEVPLPLKKELLEKKKKKHVGMAVVNVVALASFGYAFNSGMSSLPGWVFGLMLVVFSVNIGMIFWQRTLINKALAFLDERVNP